MSANHILIVARKDIGEALRSRITYLYAVMLVLLTIPFVSGLQSAVNQLGSDVDKATLQEASQIYISGLFYTLPLFSLMLFSSFLSAYAVITEKAKRTLESLLATPVSVREVWLGKSLSVALPSALVTILLLIVAMVAVNIAFVVPKVGNWVMPNAIALVTGIVIIPLMSFFVIAIVTLLQLIITNPRLANLAFIAIFLGVYIGGATQFGGRIDLHWVYIGLAVVLALAMVIVSRLLTKERVVLSSKA